MPKNDDEERRARIIERINKSRKNQNKSKSEDKINYIKSTDIERRAKDLGSHLFGEYIDT